jgi:hypothetical protein
LQRQPRGSWNRRRHLLGRQRSRDRVGHEHVRREPDQLGGETGESVQLPFSETVLQADRLVLDVAQLAQTLPEGREVALGILVKRCVSRPEHADDGDFPWRLTLGRQTHQEKPQRDNEDGRHRLHWITSLAWNRRVGGIVRPKA